MTEMIIGCVIAIAALISVFFFGYEIGKRAGLLKAEKIFDEVVERKRMKMEE